MRKKRVFDDFDHFSTEYRQIHNQNLKISGVDSDYFCEHKVIEVKRFEADSARKKILDLGCGDGMTEMYFQKHFPLSKKFGIDVSKESIKQAIRKNIPDCTFNSYDGNKILYKDNTFDVIFIACVLHHIDRRYHQKIINECYRTLKPGGNLYIFEHNMYNPLTKMLVNNCAFDHEAVLLPARYLIRIIKQAGFIRANIRYVLFFPRLKFFQPFIACERWLSKIPVGGQYYIKSSKL